MKNLTLLPILNSVKSNPASVRFLITTIYILTCLFSASDVFGQITQVGTAQTSNVGTNTVTITKPTGIAIGDLMIATISYNENSTTIDLNVAPISTGWTLIQDINLDNSNGADEWRGAVFYKVAVLADVSTTNYLFDLDNDADGVVGGLVAFTGVNPSNPFDVAPGSINVTNSDIITATSVTTVTSNTAILMLGMVSDNNNNSGWTTTSPGGLAELFDVTTTTGGDNAVGAAWALKSGTGATGNGTTSPMAQTDQNGGLLLAIRGCTPPSVNPIEGGASLVCVNAMTPAFTNTTPGGVWSTSNNAIATINGSGVATGVAIGTVNVIYTVTDVNGCSASVTTSLTVGVPAQPSTITGPSSVEPNAMGIAYAVTNVPGVTYTWEFSPGGAGWTIASGQGTSSITINAGTVFSQTLTVTPSNACGNGTPRTISISNSTCSVPTYCTTCNTNCSEPITDNPDLIGACADLRIVLVLDESTSIGATFDQDVEAGFMAFVNTLSCTGVELSVVEFNNQSRFVLDTVGGVWYHPVDDALVAAMQNYATGNGTNSLLNGTQTYAPEVGTNYTNWHSAMLAVDHIPILPNMVIFFTDGVPTKVYLTNPAPNFGTDGTQCGDTGSPQLAEYENPAKVANTLKCNGVHMFVAGVGDVQANIPILQEISGTTAYQTGINDISNSDYATGNFTELANGLSTYVSELCPFDSEVSTQDICPGDTNGSITITLPSQLLPYNYEYFNNDNNTSLGSGNNIFTNPLVISGLAVGNYRIEVEVTVPGSGCTRTEFFYESITANAVNVVASVTGTTQPTCANPDGGTATLTITAGEAPFMITLKKGGVVEPGYPISTNATSYTAMGLDAGSYTFELVDANSCNLDIDAFTINAPASCCPTTCTVTGGPGGNVCPGTQATFNITFSGGNCTTPTYSWTIINNTSNATIVGSTTNPSVTVNAGTICGAYTIQSTLTCSGCSPLVCTQTVNVVDVTAPVITTGSILACYSTVAAAQAAAMAATSATDNCGGTIIEAASTVGTCEAVVTVTETDACGNVSSTTYNTRIDNTPPTITTGSIATCYATVALAEAAALAATSATDNCSGAIVEAASTVGTCSAVVTVTETDGCGNQSFTTYNTRIDNTDPVFASCPVATINLPCNPTLPNAASAIAAAGSVSDACGPLASLTATAPAATQTNCDFSQTWTVLAVDACGNDATCQVTFTWRVDAADPVFAACPVAPINLGCNASTPNAAAAIATAGSVSDACGPLASLTATAPAATQTNCDFSQTWTVLAVDACGNDATCLVTFIWRVDITDPVFASCPVVPINLGCNPTVPTMASAIAAAGSVSDACGPLVSVTATAPSPNQSGCDYNQAWTVVAVDQCGNDASCQVQFTWRIDQVAPVCATQNITVTVDPMSGSVSITPSQVDENSSDNCGPVTLAVSPSTFTCFEAGINIVTLTVTDQCLNTSTCTATVTVEGCAPSWTLTKTSTTVPNNYDMVGDVLTYSLSLVNTGDVSISAVSLTDPLASTGPTYQSGDTDTDNVLDVGETWIYTATHNVTQGDINAGSFLNTATATGTPITGNLPPAIDTETILAVQNPNWVLVKTSTLMPNNYDMAGDVITYLITLQNTGNVSISTVSVADPQATTGPLYASGDTDNDLILDVGETWTYNATHTVVQADVDAGFFTNTATATGTPAGGTLPPAMDSETVLAITSPSIMVLKTGAPNYGGDGIPQVGETISYAFAVTNTGNVTLSNVIVTDPLVTVSGGPLASLAPGATNNSTFTATYILTQADINAGTFTNVATATGTPPTGPNVTDTDDDTQLLNQTPSILLTKTGTLDQSIVPPSGNANAGDQINYVFTVTNTGNVTLTNVTLTDPEVTVMGGPIASLAPGASNNSTFTATYTLLQSDIDAGTFTNIATATGTPPIGAAVTDTDDDTQPLNAAPSIELLKTGTLNNAIVAPNNISNVGDVITYVFTVTNAGNVTLTNITINDPLVMVMGGPITLAPGASNNVAFTATHVLTQADLDAFTFTNTATVTGTPPSGSPVTDSDDDTQPLNVVASIELLKVGTPNFGMDGVPQAGETITYAFTVTNTGVVTLTNVMVTDPLVTVSGGPIPTLLAGAVDNTTFTATYVLTQADINAGTFNNIASVTGNPPSGPPVNDTNDDTQNLPQISSINLIKTGTYVDNAPLGIYNAGDQVTYTFAVTNTGNVTLTNVTVTDPLVTMLGGPILSLAPGAMDNMTFTATYLLTQADINAGTFTNIATATGTPPSLLNVTDTDDDTQLFLLTPSITLAKTGTYVDNAPLGIYNAGDQITYTFTVTNTGNVTLTNIVLTDPLVTVSGGPIASLAPGASDNTTFTASYTLLQSDIDEGTFTNVATVTGTPPSGGNVNDTDDDMQTFTQAPSINVVKTSVTVPNNYDMAGDVLNYTITLANTGNITVYNPMMSDPGADAPEPQYVSGDTDNDNVLDVGETWNYTAVHTVTQQNVDNGSYTNVATGTGSGDTDGDGSGGDPGDTPLTDNDDETILALQTASINVVKTSTTDPNTYDMAGDVLTYAITLANTGNVTVYNPTMSDPGADAVPGVVRIADQIGDNDGILEVGEIWAYTAQHTVTQQTVDNGSYTNVATGTGSGDTDGDGIGDTPLTDNEPETINALQNPSIDVVKTSTTVPNNYDAVGDVLTYNIQLINNGNVTVYNPTMSDPTATTGPTYVSGDAGVIGVLEVGEIWIYTATHTVTQQNLDNGSYTNTATGNGMGDTNGDGIGDAPVMDSDPETINALQNTSINVVKTSTTVPNNYDMVGDVLTYTITLTNNGNVTVYTPTMSDPTATTGPTYVGGDAGVIGVLEVGETWTYTATHTVTQQDIDNGNYTNLATGNGFADTDGNGLGDTPVTDNDPETILAVQTPSINVVKTSTTMPNNYDMVGDVLTYNITLTNNGNVTVHNPTMTDPTATTGPTYVSGDVVIIGILEVGETWIFTATHTVTQQDLDNGNYTNTATGNGLADTNGDNNGDTPVTDNDPETILAIQTPSINVVKTSTTVPNDYDMVGDVLTYSITLANTGNVTVYNPTMSDPGADVIPGVVRIADQIGDNDGILEVGEIWVYTAQHTVTQQNLDNGSYTNLATGNGSADTDGNGIGDTPVTDNDPETINALQSPSINVVKTSTTMPNSYSMLGDVLTYAITMANTGNITVYNPTMSDPGADAPGPVYMSGDTDNDNVLDVGETWTYTAQHTVVQLDLTNGSYLNTATGTGSGDTNGDGMGDTPLSDSDTETVSGLFADLSLVKTVSNSTPNVGDEVTFTITVSNAGPAAATGVAVGDVIPNGYTYVPGTIMGGTTQNDGSAPTLGWTIASISSGGSAVLTFQATVLAPGAGVFYLNHAEVTDSDQYDPDSQPDPTPDEDAPAQDDEDTESVMPLVADLSLTKTVDDNTPDQGQNITYTIIVSNSGPANATGVEVTEHIPAGLFYVGSVPSQGFYNNVAGLWTVGSISNGGSAMLTIFATVTGSDIITNYVEISEVDQYDPDSDHNSSFNADDLTDMVVDDDEAIVPITVNCGDCDVINGPVGTICPGSVSVFNAQINGLCDSPVYTWTVTGNYTSFTPSGASVSVTAGTNCNQTYTVSVSIECDNCGTSPIVCTDEILVQDITPPMCATQDISITEIIDPVTGVVHFTAEMINNGSYDACGGPMTLSVFPDSLGCEDEGPNIVTLTVTDECGNTSTCTATVTIDCLDPCVKVVSWVYLEGSATDPNGLPDTYTIPMRTSLNDVQVLPGQLLVDPFFGFKYTPPGQPYSVAPWNYPGLEGNLFDSGGDPMTGDAGYPPTVVDWVLVSLREDAEGTGGPVCMAAALLHNDGHIEFVEQFECCDIDLYATYYIVIEHRNHLIVMSHDSLSVDLNNGTITYDFRIQQSYLNDPFGFGAFAQKEIQGGVFAMFAGNGDQTTSLQSDTDINFDDRTLWERENGDVGAYRFGDYNLNTDTNFNDRVTWERNNGNFTSVPRD